MHPTLRLRSWRVFPPASRPSAITGIVDDARKLPVLNG